MPETSASVLYGLYDVLFSVGTGYPDMVAGTSGQEQLGVQIVSANCRPFRCIGNIPVEPHTAIDALVIPDAVVVCDMYTSIYDVPKGRYPREAAWLKHMPGKRFAYHLSLHGIAVAGRSGALERA